MAVKDFVNSERNNPKSMKSEILMLNTADLISMQSYQRPLNKAFIEKKIKEYDPNKVNVIRVSYRDGKYYVIDGQHTIAICKGHNGGKDCLVRRLVLYGLTFKQEVELYKAINKKENDLRLPDRWIAELAYENPEYVAIKGIAEKTGWTLGIEENQRSPKNGRITALSPLRPMYKQLGSRTMSYTLKLIFDTYNGNKDSVSERYLNGMTAFMSLYSKDIDDVTFIRQMNKSTPAETIAIANTDKITPSQSWKTAKAIYYLYNKGLKKNKLPPKFDV